MTKSGGQYVLCVRPLAISAGARDLLEHGAPLFRLVHRHGVSLTIPGVDEEIFLGAPGRGLLPLHIVVRERDMLRIIDAADKRGHALPTPHASLPLQIDSSGVRIFHSRLAADPAGMHSNCARSNIAALAHWLRAIPVPLGLGMSADELLARDGTAQQWVCALNEGSPSSEAALFALLGRGAGSTPAGDDLLIGMLAQAWATAGENAPLVTMLRALSDRLPLLTTTASVTYLRAAARGEFGSHLTVLVRSLHRVQSARALALAARVASHGVTSGLDTLAGFVAANEVV